MQAHAAGRVQHPHGDRIIHQLEEIAVARHNVDGAVPLVDNRADNIVGLTIRGADNGHAGEFERFGNERNLG